MNLTSWPVRAAIVGGLTFLAWKYAPNAIAKTVALAVGGVSTAYVIASGVPLVSGLLAGQLPGVNSSTSA